ncbi:hypothetical protein ART_2764 [Arthrobacter sp. PAMC 25486]|nr:hypothetical protein ART_2764 [Arthrobacter sp. PAMC 25486]
MGVFGVHPQILSTDLCTAVHNAWMGLNRPCEDKMDEDQAPQLLFRQYGV